MRFNCPDFGETQLCNPQSHALEIGDAARSSTPVPRYFAGVVHSVGQHLRAGAASAIRASSNRGREITIICRPAPAPSLGQPDSASVQSTRCSVPNKQVRSAGASFSVMIFHSLQNARIRPPPERRASLRTCTPRPGSEMVERHGEPMRTRQTRLRTSIGLTTLSSGSWALPVYRRRFAHDRSISPWGRPLDQHAAFAVLIV